MLQKQKPLDLREHARRSLRFLGNSVDAGRRDLPYFRINFAANPPRFEHAIHFDDTELTGRWYYATQWNGSATPWWVLIRPAGLSRFLAA